MNEECKHVETIESMNMPCITIQVTCPEDNSNDQIEFQRTFQNLDAHFERPNEYYTAEVSFLKKRDKLKQKP